MSRFAEKHRTQASQIQEVEAAYTSLMRAQRGFVGVMIACALLGATVLHGRQTAPVGRLYLPVILATALLTFAFVMRNALVLPALAELRRDPRNPKLLRRWGRFTLMVQGLCVAVGLTGFALQLIGSQLVLPLAIYAIAVAYLFLLRPVRP
jgi:hypothetical protein